MPQPGDGEDAVGWRTTRWLGGLGLGLAPIADASSFSWAGPWIGWVQPRARGGQRCAVVMYGVPSGVAFDPASVTETGGWHLDGGHVLAALDIAQARPSPPQAPESAGTIAGIYLAAEAGAPVRPVPDARALADRGLNGDHHVIGTGTFPSGLPGSALTLIQAEVCESFTPPLEADEHRRNVVTRGIDLNGLVGREFLLGSVRCRGMRLCEPCTVVAGYASRPVLRPPRAPRRAPRRHPRRRRCARGRRDSGCLTTFCRPLGQTEPADLP
ncbi:MAG: MOSC domain-containing protein [Streptosporangiaceae bacterium]